MYYFPHISVIVYLRNECLFHGFWWRDMHIQEWFTLHSCMEYIISHCVSPVAYNQICLCTVGWHVRCVVYDVVTAEVA